MKITSYIYIIFIVTLYALNYAYLKIKLFTFTGIVLAALIVLVIIINIYVKLRNKQKGLHSEDFIFSPEAAKRLREINIGIQYESSIIATFFLIIGLLLFAIYTIFFTQYDTIVKVFITFNTFFAMILMSSMLITSYQQFISYRESVKMIQQFTGSSGSEVVSQQTMADIVKISETLEETSEEKPLKDKEIIDFTEESDKEFVDRLFKKLDKVNNQTERRNN